MASISDSHPQESYANATRILNRILTALAITVAILARILAVCAAGGIWRDEVHSVNVANLPFSHNWFGLLARDSFPILWQLVLRGWIGLFGGADYSVRILGFVIGLAQIPALWWCLRQFGVRFPWVSLLLLALDPVDVVYGSEVRGYGLGIVTLLMMIGSAWLTWKQPCLASWSQLLIASLLAVQSSFTNCFLLAATLIACAIVATLRRKLVTLAFGFGLVGAIAAASMLPYLIYILPQALNTIRGESEVASFSAQLLVCFKTLAWGGSVRGIVALAAISGSSWTVIRLLRHSLVGQADQPAAQRRQAYAPGAVLRLGRLQQTK